MTSFVFRVQSDDNRTSKTLRTLKRFETSTHTLIPAQRGSFLISFDWITPRTSPLVGLLTRSVFEQHERREHWGNPCYIWGQRAHRNTIKTQPQEGHGPDQARCLMVCLRPTSSPAAFLGHNGLFLNKTQLWTVHSPHLQAVDLLFVSLFCSFVSSH